jgi:mRNA export factor
MYDLNTGQSIQVAAHDAPVKCVRWIDAPNGGILATGSWDKTVKVNFHYNYGINWLTPIYHYLQYWDLRSPKPVASLDMAERVYSMDVQYPLMVVGTAQRHIQVVNLNSPTVIFKVRVQTTMQLLGT